VKWKAHSKPGASFLSAGFPNTSETLKP